MEGSEETQRSYKDLKRMAKEQKKAKKKGKKKNKMERKIAKKENKMRKKGVFLEDVTPSEEAVDEEQAEEFAATPWIRKSTDDIPYLEKKIDRMAERKESSSLHDMFEEKFGESLMAPETFREYELSEAEKRRLEKIRAMDEPAEEASTEVVAVVEEEAVEAAPEGKAKKAKKEKKQETGTKSFWDIKQLWLYSKYGKEKGKVLKLFIMLFSIVGLLIRIPLCIIAFLPRFIGKKLKARKAKKVAAEA